MNSTEDFSIRPTTAAELPPLAHVTSREQRRRQEPARPSGKKGKSDHDNKPADSQDAQPAGDGGDEPTGTIDLLA